jgi:hypothetical protein
LPRTDLLAIARRRFDVGTRAATALLAAGGWALVSMATASAATDAGVVQVVSPANGAAVNAGGSATLFTFKLPAGATCPGDTEHQGYLLFGYTVPVAVNPQQVTFGGGEASIGAALIDAGGTPYVAVATGVNSGAVVQPPAFVWSRYDHHPEVLPAGTYNVGLACVLDNRVVTYWNTPITFVASSTDPGGFTWKVADPVPISSHGSSAPVLAIVAVTAGVVLAVGLAWGIRRRRKPAAATVAPR